MKTKFFYSKRYPGDWEFNLQLGKYSFRIGKSQIALWKNYEPIFNKVFIEKKQSVRPS